MKELFRNDELKVDKYYHCFDKKTGKHSIQQCLKGFREEPKYLGINKIWADDDSNQALQRWHIFGPITPPLDQWHILSGIKQARPDTIG